jgi:hypothetical protein
MHVVLLALGLAISVAGIALIGFGAFNAADLGNTLLIAGTIAIVGSLILIGLSTAIRQLRRIAQALETRQIPPGAAEAAPPPSLSVPSPEPRVEPEPQRIEPKIEPAVAAVAAVPEPPLPVPEAVPQAVPEPVAVKPEEPAAEPPPAPPPAPPPPSPAKPERVFDRSWSGEPAVAVEAAVVEVASRPPEPPPPAGTPEPEPVRIFKSGVIDGMAYTLYTDGSIEAELAEGSVMFASIDELRASLAARE